MPSTHSDLQERLESIEASFTRMLNHLPGLAYRCVVEQDYEYTLVFVSKGCEKLLGISQNDVMRNPTNTIERMTLEEDLARMRKTLHDALVKRHSYSMYYRIRMPDDEVKWIWDQGEGVFDDSGECIFLEGIMMDVTAQKATEQKLKKENRQLRSSASKSGGLGRIIGKSAAMQAIYDLILKAAKSDTNVILYGETGVGKDLVAKTIHELSGVKGRYIPVNCAAIPEQLLESEFFGHVKGAFSGANSNRQGYLAAADGGTLFLDEIAELPINLQVKLLRALESRTYTPVGSSEPKKSKFRLISATNRNLKAMVRRRAMRADFFYRIHVLTITIPPLRERTGDIPLLIEAYAKFKAISEPVPEHIEEVLESHCWPGNVRELQNTLDRYWAFGDLDIQTQPVCPDIFDFDLEREDAGQQDEQPRNRETRGAFEPGPAGGGAGGAAKGAAPFTEENKQTLMGERLAAPSAQLADVKSEIEKQKILSTLDQCDWKKGRTADALGITMRTLQRKIKKYAIQR